MKRSTASLRYGALSLLIFATATAARANDALLLQALVALAGAVETPSSCGTDKKCQGAYRKAFDAFSAAEQSLEGGDASRALSSASKGAAALEKAGQAGGLTALLGALVDGADAVVAGSETEIGDSIAGLCSRARCGLEAKLAKPADQLALARQLGDAGSWSGALRAYAAALSGYASVSKGFEKARVQCSPSPCSSSASVHFTPGAGPALELIPPDVGTSACLDVSSDIDVDGTLCFVYAGRGRSEVSGSLSLSDIEFALDGKLAVAACIDSANWLRIQKLRIALSLESDEFGRESESLSVSATPPTVSFFGGLLPTPPSASRLRAGDRMEEKDTLLRVAGVGEQHCDSIVHRVAAIEDVSVRAGTFRAARIETSGSCRITMDGEEIDTAVEATTWVASEVGQVLIESEVDGMLIRYELSSVAVPEGC